MFESLDLAVDLAVWLAFFAGVCGVVAAFVMLWYEIMKGE